ncbi:MAG TPA: hypothetical protein VFK02_08830 [Kofleriaceae bacterium]|nr:hypothetical protein [Kofleriaceae bacterium]
MLDHKRPGKSSLAGGAAHDHHDHHPHHPAPGKHTQVELAARGALAHAAMAGGGPQVSTSTSKSVSFHEGPLLVQTTVGVSLSHGNGPVSIDLSGGGMSVGNDHMTVDFKSPGAATGKSLPIGGASVTVTKNSTQRSGFKMSDGYAGFEYTTSWTVKAKGWTSTVAVTSFVGHRPVPKPHHGIIGKVIHAVGHVLHDVAHELAKISESIVHSAPKWGPVLVAALAAIASAPESAVTG